MVGCRNFRRHVQAGLHESIKHSDGGVSERSVDVAAYRRGVYQAFRWWGVGTHDVAVGAAGQSLSSIPMVGCRNITGRPSGFIAESIKHSDGGVSEPTALVTGAG